MNVNVTISNNRHYQESQPQQDDYNIMMWDEIEKTGRNNIVSPRCDSNCQVAQEEEHRRLLIRADSQIQETSSPSPVLPFAFASGYCSISGGSECTGGGEGGAKNTIGGGHTKIGYGATTTSNTTFTDTMSFTGSSNGSLTRLVSASGDGSASASDSGGNGNSGTLDYSCYGSTTGYYRTDGFEKRNSNKDREDASILASSSSSSSWVIYPWNSYYQLWWIVTVIASIVTTFFETYQIGFTSSTSVTLPYYDSTNHGMVQYLEYVLTIIFIFDFVINLKYLAYYNDDSNHDHHVVNDPRLITKHYVSSRKFYIDIVTLVPFQYMLLTCVAPVIGSSSSFDNELSNNDDYDNDGFSLNDAASSYASSRRLVEYIAFVRLLRLLRLYRVIEIFDLLAVDTRISLMTLTLIRNFAAAFLWTHVAACTIYFIARVEYNLDPSNTFIGSKIEDTTNTNDYQCYIISLYWSTVTFATVGYGDFYRK